MLKIVSMFFYTKGCLMKNYIRVGMQLFSVVMIFSAHMTFGMLGRYQPKKGFLSNKMIGLSKQYPYLQSKIQNIYEKVTLEDFDVEPEQIHLLPIDSDTLKMLDLCPLFEKPHAIIEPEVRESLDKNEIRIISEMQIVEKMPKYHVFKDSGFEIRHTDLNIPCVVPLGKFGDLNRTLIQFKSLDQDELAKATKLSQFLCAGHSLNNGRLIRNYALDGEVKYLKKLHDIQESVGFLLDLGIGEWPDVKSVKQEIKNVGKLLDVNTIDRDISAVSTVLLFGSHVGLLDQQEFDYVQTVKRKIQRGLAQNNYVHIIIIGNEEFTVKHGHYFCFAIIKSGNEVQYLVLDTLPGVYHLQEGSHERDRLMFLIDNIERDSSLVNVASLSAMPEFMQSVGQQDEESMLEVELSRERLQEADDFENQIKFVNDFSKTLNRFGVKKQLAKESKEFLSKCLDIIKDIANVYGEENTYPTLRKLIEGQIGVI